MNAAQRCCVAIDGGEVALLRFGREGAPPLLFAHANGFCASAYRRMLEALGDRFDVFAVDLRGHGRTRLPAEPGGHRSMAVFGEDLRRVRAALAALAAKGPWTLAGHSLGGVAAATAAAGEADVAALRLIEPVAMPKRWSMLAASPVWPLIAPRIPLVRAAARRRSRWPDRRSALASYAAKPFFAGWAEGIIEDYLEDGLLADGEGVRLACAPAWEAANFAAQANDLWGALKRCKAPISVLAAAHPSSTVPEGSERRFRRLGARVDRLAGVTHLVPFEKPQVAAAFLASPS
ncbi:MAG: alpha/beta fold hydrolase [Parvularculaceae bacterium]